MKFFILSILISSVAFSQTPSPEASQCRSQLMRMQVDSNALTGVLQNSQTLQRQALPALQTFLASDTFKESFVRDYPLEPVGFPFNKELCEREKQRDTSFAAIDCNNPSLCSSNSISEEIKTRLCFALPCSFVMGSRMNQCRPNSIARPTTLNFTRPISLRAIDIVPQALALEGNTIRSCFNINSMALGFSVGIGFENRGQAFEDIGLNNLEMNLDGGRQVCLSAQVDLSKTPILTGVRLENVTGQPFISDAMIDRSLRTSSVTGLDGYTPATLEILKLSGLPPMARHFRPTIEAAVANVLSTTFETTVATYLTGLGGNRGPARLDTPADSMVSELGVGNLAVKKYVDLLDCAIMKRERKIIPADNACLTTNYTGSNTILYSQATIPTPERAAQRLREVMGRNENVTSESLRKRLTDFEPRLRALSLAPFYQREVLPVAQQIQAAQSNSTLMSGIEMMGQLNNNAQLSVGFCLPEICDQEKPSTHEGRSIPNCPIQTYVDINELNSLMRAMYNSGRLCHRGRGDFVPQKDNRGEVVRRDGFAQGAGCVFAVEEDPDGLRCYLNGPPTMRFDPATRRYNVAVRTRECYRGGVFVGQGKIGGDIDFNIGFTPSICNGGDFCLQNGQADWNVVPGTARHALRESSWLNGMIRRRIDQNLNEMISSSIRFPLTSTQGPLSNIPLAPEGRVDLGEGYFGACLKVR
ncbi:MAG: hypothetical protein V4598_01000 [Bdellovibrionota bacterium]